MKGQALKDHRFLRKQAIKYIGKNTGNIDQIQEVQNLDRQVRQNTDKFERSLMISVQYLIKT